MNKLSGFGEPGLAGQDFRALPPEVRVQLVRSLIHDIGEGFSPDRPFSRLLLAQGIVADSAVDDYCGALFVSDYIADPQDPANVEDALDMYCSLLRYIIRGGDDFSADELRARFTLEANAMGMVVDDCLFDTAFAEALDEIEKLEDDEVFDEL